MAAMNPPGMAKTVSVVREKTKKPTPVASTMALPSMPGFDGTLGPQSLDSNRDAWANALSSMSGVYTPDPISAVAKVAGMGLAGYGQGKATKAKEAGSSAYKQKLADVLSGNPDNGAVMGMMSDPYADEQSQRMLMEIWQRNNPTQDEQLARQKTQIEIEQMQQPASPDYDMKPGADGQMYYVPKVPGQGEVAPVPGFTPRPDNSGVTVDARQMGNIPPGYRADYDEQGRVTQLVPIPGGPAAAEAEQAGNVADARQDKRMTMTDTVTGAADAARGLIGNMSTGLIGQGMSYWGQSDAAEVYRQVDVLKSTATIENLNAMRRESPTGGALGNVTEKEGAMLAAAAGAIDPASGPERFQEQLDNYEMTLMRVIHGYDVGTQMFEQRKAEQTAPGVVAPQGADAPPPNVDPELWQYMTPEERQLWQGN